jgi:hypothetical protein
MEAVFLLVVGSTSSRVLAITALTLAVGFSGFAISGIFFPSLHSIKEISSSCIENRMYFRVTLFLF